MVTVTDRAKEELRRIAETNSLDTGKYLRLATPPVWTGDGDFGIVIDEERSGDHVLDLEGTKLLLVDPDLAEPLSKAVLDFKESLDGARFTLDVH